MTETVPPFEASARQTRPRRWWIAGVVVVLLVAAAAWARTLRSAKQTPGVSPGGAGGDRVVPVVVTTAARQDVPLYLEGLGNVTPLQTVTVRSQVDGRLDKVLFREGQTVHKGDVLAQIDPRPFVIALHQAEAALARDQAQSKNAALNLERYRSLVAKNLIAQQQVDDQSALADQTEAATQSDRAQVENARLQIEYARIVSSIDGVTGVRQVDPGNIVHAADPTGIVVITQLDPIAVTFTFPQDVLPRVAKQLAEGSVPLDALSRDGSTRLAGGELQMIDNEINPSTATAKLKGAFPNTDRALWPNQFVKVRALVGTRREATVIPAAAVQRGPQGSFVYVIGPDDTAAMRPVEIESVQGESAIIAHGVLPGDRVVSDGQSQLRPGSKVSARPTTSAAASSARAAPPAAPPSGSAR